MLNINAQKHFIEIYKIIFKRYKVNFIYICSIKPLSNNLKQINLGGPPHTENITQ